MRRRSRIVLGIALFVGLLLRIEYFRELILSPFGRHLILDAQWYDGAARLILGGGELDPGRAYFRPPGYPFFLAGLYRVFGAHVDVVRVVQWLLGLVHVPICWAIARRTHGEAVAAVTAVLAATYGMFVYFEGEILTTALGTFLGTLAAWLLLEGDARDSVRWTAAGGLALGVASTIHATALAVAPAAFLWILFRSRRRLLAAVVLTLATSVPVLAVTARNFLAGGEPVLLATQGGINFFVGNNPEADGKSALAPGLAEADQTLRSDSEYRDTIEIAAETLAARALGHPPTPGEIHRYWMGQGLAWMHDHPKEAAVLLGRKVLYFLNGYEISNNRDLRDQARRFTPILRGFLVQWSILAPFGLLGLFVPGIGTRPRLLLFAWLLAYAAAIVAFFVCARYRQPAIAWMLPFVGAGILQFFRAMRHAVERPRRFAFTLAGLVAAFLITNPRFVTATGLADVTTDRDAPFHRYNLAVLYEQEQNYDRAIEEYRATIASGVPDPRAWLNLGNTLARTGRLDEARDAYRETLRIAPDYAVAVHSNLGILAAQQGDWREAIRRFEEVLSRDPDHRGALLSAGAAYLTVGRFDDAILVLRRALTLGYGPETTIRRNLAVAYLEAGLVEDGTREAEIAYERAPDEVANVVALLRARAAAGDLDEAARLAARARELKPGAPDVERALEEVLGPAEGSPASEAEDEDLADDDGTDDGTGDDSSDEP
ncbi:MAG: tetratricopeptide repeat protein [bacterium]